jgi:hypothetical protein
MAIKSVMVRVNGKNEDWRHKQERNETGEKMAKGEISRITDLGTNEKASHRLGILPQNFEISHTRTIK